MRLLACWLVSCAPPVEKVGIATTQDGWETAQPKDVGIDGRILTELVDHISNDKYQNIDSLMIIKDLSVNTSIAPFSITIIEE